jgi:hypothetical protein
MDNLVVLNGGGTPVESDVQKLYDTLKETIYNTSEEGNLTLSSAIGILEILKLDLLSEQSQSMGDN